jgi:sugar diacid utilization regulator
LYSVDKTHLRQVEVTESARHSPSLDVDEHIAKLQGLLALGRLMMENRDEHALLGLAGSSVRSLGPFQLLGIHLADRGWAAVPGTRPHANVASDLEQQLHRLPPPGGRLVDTGDGWAWAYALDSADGLIGHLAIASDTEPALWAEFLVGILAQQTSIALANSRLYASQRAQAAELQSTLAALERSVAIHERLTEVAIRGEGEQGIALALYELTGWQVVIEDPHGNVRAWAGPGLGPPYLRRSAAAQAELIRRAKEAGRPVAIGDQLVAVARPRPDTLGVIVLVGLPSEAVDRAQVALEHGATVLAVELARLQSIADTELRLGRDLVEELLAHVDEQAALSRARAMGYDLDRRHQVSVVVEDPSQPREPDARFHAVRRAARDANVGTLLVPRGDAVVVVGRDQPDWGAFHRQLVSELGERVRVGVGAPCDDLAGFPRSYHQARLALRMRDTGVPGSVLFYERLGSYRLLAEVSDLGAIDRFVEDWLGPLIAYDARHGADLVRTLTWYLECRGSYEDTAAALYVHRNTLKYRLRRITEVANRDLKDGDTLFNLQLATRAWSTRQALESQESIGVGPS